MTKALGDPARVKGIDLVLPKVEMGMGIHGCVLIYVNGIHIINTVELAMEYQSVY
jgi:hypothetical protein